MCNSKDRPASSGTDTAVLQLEAVHMSAGDAIRPFLLHAYGGLYMDVDVECFDATDDMVDGFDLVSLPGQPQWCRLVAVCICWQPTFAGNPQHVVSCESRLLGHLSVAGLLLPSCMRALMRKKRMKRQECAVSTGASAGGQWQQVAQQCSHGRSPRPRHLGQHAAPTQGQVGSASLFPWLSWPQNLHCSSAILHLACLQSLQSA